MKNRAVPVLIVLVLIIIIGSITGVGLVREYKKGSTQRLDYEEAYGLEENEYAIVLNNKTQSYPAVEIDGAIYIDAESVASSVNDRFYWDSYEKIFIYTKATEIIKAFPDEQCYYVDGQQVSLDYVPVKTMVEKSAAELDDDGNPAVKETVYVSVEYIKLFSQCELETYTEPNRVVITTQWGEEQTVSAKEDTVLRYEDHFRADVVTDLPANETVTVLETEEDWSWSRVATDDGFIGWVDNKFLNDIQTVTTTAPPSKDGEFTYLKEDGLICLAWHQITNAAASSVANLQQALNNTQGITIVAPTWFTFNGTKGHVTSIANADYVNYAHQQGLKVWAVFQNTTNIGGEMNGGQTDNVLRYTSKRETLISELMAYVLEYDIDGINLDFEMILEEGADNYIQFVRELSVACRLNGITFSVDNYVPLYTRHYNRAEQAKFADYVVIMGYDEYGGFSGEAGPGASLPFVKQGIEETLELIGGDSSKVINGVPFYTTGWVTVQTSEGPSDRALEPSTMSTTKGYLQKYPDRTQVSWNEELGYYYGTYTSPVDDNLYRMWLEDEHSIGAKLNLMREYDLAGVACWKLQQEDPEVWPVISAYLNGEPIPQGGDVAESESDQTE